MSLFNNKRDFPGTDDSGEIEKLTKMMTDLTEKFTSMQQFSQSLASNQQQMSQMVQKLDRDMGGLSGASSTSRDMTELDLAERDRQAAAAAKKSVYDLTPEETDNMTEGQKFQLFEAQLVGKFQSAIESAMKPIAAELSNTQQLVATNQTQSVLGKLREAHKDFDDWLPSIAELRKADSYKSVPLEDLYAIAKSKDPERAATLDDKYNPKDKLRDVPYGGLLSDVSPETTETGDLSVEEASLEAAKEYIGENGQSPFNVDESMELELMTKPN